VLWLATHFHWPFCLIQVSVNRARLVYGFPLVVPVSRYTPVTTPALL
jgi:hypothetical protein